MTARDRNLTRQAARHLLFYVWIIALLLPAAATPCDAFDWVPSDEEIQKYRKSWNPFSEGPLLIQSVDIHPAGQLSVRPFVFSQVAEKSYGNTLSLPSEAKDGPVHTYAVSPLVTMTYGLSNHFELGAATSMIAFWSKDTTSANAGNGGPWTTDAGMGDTSIILKYRPVVQDPDSARPSFTLYQQLILPTSRWTGTERPPGGVAPLGRLPSTRFGELGFTEGATFRKNLKPFRLSGGVYYTYSAPGSDNNQTTYVGDVINTRLVFEHFLSEKHGFAYNLELATVHTGTWRLDGHSVNRGAVNGSTVIGIEPAIQFKLTDSIVGALGVLFTVAGQNAADAIYPNFAFQWYWNQGKKVIMR
ncbi:conserved exported protein of unknown function [Nitrospira sp. KM1]|uniref:hypothetical protein n=1 Tax=Nitrospira sp. KM1 TaxID=1936990 RepID=UPI0013A78013|nr:hypothetical protein [Nitrospira sp. KM1]BCA53937.1 conserved exported protein of unknown function [Nitrospira sp. KM1]